MSETNEILEQILEVKGKIEETTKDLNDAISERDAEIEENSKSSKKTGERVDELGEKLIEWESKFDAQVEQAAADSKRLGELEAAQSDPGGVNGDGAKAEDFFDLFVKDESFLTYKKNRGTQVIENIGDLRNIKATLIGSSDITSPQPASLPGIVDLPRRKLMIRDLVTELTAATDSVAWLRKTFWHPLYTTADGSTSIGDATIDVDEIEGFEENQIFTIDAEGTDPEEVTVVSIATKTITFTPVLTSDHLNAVVVSSTTIEPRSVGGTIASLKSKIAKITRTVQSIDTMFKIPDEFLEDNNALRESLIQDGLQGLGQSIEWQILYGNTSDNDTDLHGILNDDDIQSRTWTAGNTLIDEVLEALTLVELVFHEADGVILYPTDKKVMDATKGTDGHYIWMGNPATQGGRPWGMNIISTVAIAKGTMLTGAFRNGYWLFNRRRATVEMTNSDGTDFKKRITAVRMGERMAGGPKYPNSFVSTNISDDPGPA